MIPQACSEASTRFLVSGLYCFRERLASGSTITVIFTGCFQKRASRDADASMLRRSDAASAAVLLRGPFLRERAPAFQSLFVAGSGRPPFVRRVAERTCQERLVRRFVERTGLDLFNGDNRLRELADRTC